MKDALADAAHQLRLGGLESFFCRFPVVLVERGFDLLHMGPDTAAAGAVDVGAAGVAARPLFGRFDVRHRSYPLPGSNGERLLARPPRSVNRAGGGLPWRATGRY